MLTNREQQSIFWHGTHAHFLIIALWRNLNSPHEKHSLVQSAPRTRMHAGSIISTSMSCTLMTESSGDVNPTLEDKSWLIRAFSRSQRGVFWCVSRLGAYRGCRKFLSVVVLKGERAVPLKMCTRPWKKTMRSVHFYSRWAKYRELMWIRFPSVPTEVF